MKKKQLYYPAILLLVTTCDCGLIGIPAKNVYHYIEEGKEYARHQQFDLAEEAYLSRS